MKAELISKLEELLQMDAGEVAHDVRALQKEYQKQWTNEFEKARLVFIEQGGKSKEFEYPKQEEDNKFEALVEQFAKLKKENDAKLAGEQARNLTVRTEIIAKIRDLSQLSVNVAPAIKKLQELQTQWKETGQVSSHKYKEVQAEYSKAIEEFYYNLKIYRDLQEHDLKKNFENKSILIEKLKGVANVESIKEAERLIKVFRNEWDEIGPVPNDKWEGLKAEYKGILDDTYARIKAYYGTVEEKKGTNLVSKQALIEKAKEIAGNLQANSGPAKWNSATEELIALQAEWKGVGRTTEKENEKVWAEFRQICDEFFEKKKEYFSKLNEKFAESRKIKAELITKAEAVQNSTDWQKTTQVFFRLQEDWKKNAGQGDKEESKMYAKFRKACDTFFEARKTHFADKDAAFEESLKVKEEIITRLNAFEPGIDNKANYDVIKAFIAEWNNAGHVPMKEKNRVNDLFFGKIDALYEKMNVDKTERAAIQFRNKVDRLATSDNAFETLRKEGDYLKKIADEIKGNLLTYENNLGFFKHSKANPLMKEFENKIAEEKAKLDEVQAKRKLITEELNKIRDAANKAEA
jgi:hypothetical protein